MELGGGRTVVEMHDVIDVVDGQAAVSAYVPSDVVGVGVRFLAAFAGDERCC